MAYKPKCTYALRHMLGALLSLIDVHLKEDCAQKGKWAQKRVEKS